MKKIIAIIMALCLVSSLAVFAGAVSYYGDVDGDGNINSSDALSILRYAVGIEKEIDEKTADITKDGEINSSDALAVLQTAVGMLEAQIIEEEPETPDEPEKNPLDYSKEEIIEFFNKAVEGSYKENVSVTSSELVSITLNSITGGETVKNLANSIVSKYTEPTTLTQTFSDGKAEDETALKYFTACGGIDADGVKTASIKKNGNGYEVELTIVEEKADLANPPKYNSQASRPLDINSIDLMGAKVSKADYTYTGTVLKAVIDENGKITATSVRMPLAVIGEGKLTVFKISVDASGVYTNESVFEY